MKNIITQLKKNIFARILVILVAFVLVVPADVFAQTLPSLPTARTSSARFIEGDSAVLRGSVDPRGTTDTKFWFEWGTEVPLSRSTVQTNQGPQAQSVIFPLTGLELNTRYFYRVVAENSAGIVYGSTLSFKTDRVESSVSKGHPIAITEEATIQGNGTSVTLNGYVDTKGVLTRVWFEWGQTRDLGLTTERSKEIRASGNFSQSITGLTPGTLYYYRAVASNDNGTSFATILSVTPGVTSGIYNPPTFTGGIGQSPIAITNQAEDISETRATLTGEVVQGNVSVPALVWFEWGQTPALGNFTSTREASFRFSENLFGLTPNTTYYYKSVVSNQYGVDDGSIRNFTTSPSYIYEDEGEVFAPLIDEPVGDDAGKSEKIEENGWVAGVFFGFGSILPQNFGQWVLYTVTILVIILLARGYRLVFTKKEKLNQ